MYPGGSIYPGGGGGTNIFVLIGGWFDEAFKLLTAVELAGLAWADCSFSLPFPNGFPFIELLKFPG